MKKRMINMGLIGKKLGEPVINMHGQLLLEKGTELVPEMILLLVKRGIEYVIIDERGGADSSPELESHEELVDRLVHKIRGIYTGLKLGNSLVMDQINDIAEPIYDEVFRNRNIMNMILGLNVGNSLVHEHLIKTSSFAGLIASWIGYNRADIRHCILAGLLHDIGKCNIPDAILEKNGPLTDDERKIASKHAYFSYVLIKPIFKDDKAILEGVKNHHERMDGSGYPEGLTDSQIDHISRVVAVADVFSAVTSDVAYRPAYNPFMAFEILAEEKLDSYIVDLFVTKASDLFLNQFVKLTNGDVGEVIHINRATPSRPVVSCGNIYIDLSRDRHIAISACIDPN